MQSHVDATCHAAAQSLHAIKLLQSHGLDQESIHAITTATVVTRLTYASPAWYGFISAQGKQQ